MSDTPIVYVSPDGDAELEDLNDLIAGEVPEVNWVATLNGEEVPIKLRLADVDTGPVISKTTFAFTVLHRTDEPVETLEEAMERADTGHAVGNWTIASTDPVTDEMVPIELQRLGNDGTFFDDDLNPEETP